jgi:putative glutamine amidotransferase
VDRPFPLFGSVAIQDTYVDAVYRSGAVAAVLGSRPLTDSEADDIVASIDGLVLTGGTDVNPALYGETPHESVYGISDLQDSFESKLYYAAIRAKLPTLAICRGLQLINVLHGGTLDQHIVEMDAYASHGIPNGGAPTRNSFTLEPGSLLAKVYEAEVVEGDCHHHQAAGKVGEGLVVVARTADGGVEGLELADYDGWFTSTQWHPEDTAAFDPVQQRPFNRLCEAARG